MRKLLHLAALVLLAGIAAAQVGPFQGYGANATGGTTVVHVTNNSASGAGSLNACATAGGNHCVFDGAYTIATTSSIKVGSNTTIDGFSAPGVVTLTTGDGLSGGACMYIQNSHNVIIQGLRFRNCNGVANIKALEIADTLTAWRTAGNVVYDIVIDHNEFIEASDELVGLNNVHNATISWNLMKNSGGDSGCEAHLFGTRLVTSHHNLYVNCTNASANTRVPLAASGWSCCFDPAGTHTDLGIIADVRWNVASDFTPFGFIAATDNITKNSGNLVGNYYDSSDSDHARSILQFPAQADTSWHLSGNASVLNPTGAPSSYYSGNVDGDYADPTTPFCIANSNKIDCTTETVWSPGATCGASGLAANSCQPSIALATPTVTGPCVYDAAARVTEWTSVKNTSGVQPHFADDATAAALRAGVTTPTLAMVAQSWNTQTGSCSGIPPATTRTVGSGRVLGGGRIVQ